MLLAVPYSFRSRFTASLICLSGGTYRVISSVWLPSLLPSKVSVLLSLNSSKDVFLLVLNVFTITGLSYNYVPVIKIKVSQCKREMVCHTLTVSKLHGFLQVKLYILFQLGENAVLIFYPFETVLNAR